MSLTEITRNCFQSGISAQKWLALCKDFVNENPILGNPESVASGISNSVLFLYRSYPADSSLNKYLVYALKDGILPLHVYVATFLSAARSADFHSGATLDFLCDLALRTHEESSQIPPPALLSPSASPLANLETVQDALCLVQTSHTMILNYHHHKLVQNSERLLSHLLSYNTDVSQMTITQVWLAYSTTIDIMRVIQLDAQVRVRLKQFAMELNRVIQDDAKAAREAQMMQSMQVAKQSVGSLNSETDVVSLGLLWQYLVKHRARDFGAGNTEKVVALLVSAWRWSSWTAPVFCTQVFVSLFTCLTSCPTLGEPALWRAFILGRVPSYLAAFQKVVSTDQGLSTDLRTAFRQGIRAALRRQDLLVPGDHFISQATGSNGASDGQTSFARKFVQQLLKADLIEQTVVQEVEPLLGPSAPAHESQDMNVDLTCDFDVRLAQDPDLLEANHWLDRIWKDENSHRPLAALVLKRFELSSTGGDVEPFGRLCQLLYTHRFALDLVSLHVKVSDLVFYALSFLEAYDCESVGDPQTGVSQVGNVVLFLQYTIIRFQFEEEVFTKDGQSFSTTFLRHTDEVLPIESAQLPETAAFHSWFKALFDSSSEGIEDSILRSTHPKVLLRISATLFSQAIKAAAAHKIDSDILTNGVSYFTGPILNWTLVGVIKALIKEIRSSTFKQPPPDPQTVEILQTLITSTSCPQPVLALCSAQVLRFLADEANNNSAHRQSLDIAAVEDVVRRASNRTGNSPFIDWEQYPKHQIRTALSMARDGKIVDLDVDRCLKILQPTTFLQVLWADLSAERNEIELCRRVATFVLAMPRNSQSPPLLPLFIHLFLPSLLHAMDNQKTQDPTVVELTSCIILSTLTAAFHLEWSMTTVLKDNRTILGASSSSMARRLANDLRNRRNGAASQAILQRLASSQVFVTNFPYFAPEFGN